MSFRKASVAAMAALSLTSAPVFAQAASPVASQARAGVSLQEENQLGGGFIIPLLALAAVIAGILVVVGGDDEDRPTSP